MSVRMSDALRSKHEILVRLLARANKEEILTRHEIGVTILEIRHAEDMYGSGAIGVLAAALRMDAATLYRYGQVAACWDRATLQQMVTPEHGGDSLSWSHLVELCAVPDERLRHALVEEVVA
jgi:hypothetical protein